jgi:UDP-N-acetylglucosamine 4,6-dehydratase
MLHTSIIKILLNLSRRMKTILVMFVDYLVLVFSFWASLSVRLNSFYNPSLEANYLIIFGPVIAVPIFYLFGLYQSLIRYSNYRSLLTITLASSIYTIVWFVIVLVSGVVDKPYDFLIINWLMTIFLTGVTRYIAKWSLSEKSKSVKNILIYGAGNGGIQLESALKYSPDIFVVGFIDDDIKMHGRYIENKKVFSPDRIPKLIKSKDISDILIAIPSLSRSRKYNLLQSLKGFPVIIKALPGFSEIATGKLSISDLKTVRIEDLLHREVVKPDEKLLIKDISNKNVLVTGAGGSIGSEICRQIIRLKPKLLILLEISEVSLYLIERELREKNSGVTILAMIGDITRRNRLDFILNNYEVDTIYHTAAYKHVPLVEKNTIPGIRCNIFGTLTLIQAAMNSNIESFVFISTDKAVRPTNIMGATKRFAEMILQSIATNQLDSKKKIRISMVRFGNVLGSSGSVVPLFKSQIENGGPITVTHPGVIRYFMTLEEASQLVIQAGAMGSDGEIFLLDMGEPIYILDLAKDMVRLSGMTVKDDKNLDGDIEITYTGLRKGEKLVEELLIDKSSSPTRHKKITKANDKHASWEDLEQHIFDLEEAIIENDFQRIGEIFVKTVSGYQRA